MKKKIFGNLLLLCLFTIVSIVFVELSYRSYLNLRYERKISKFKHPLFKIERGGILEMSMMPNTQRANKIKEGQEATWTYTTNADGYRGRDVAHQKEKGIKRIVFLGDSYTFGWGVNDDEIYTERFKALWEKDNNFNVEVINLAVPGYNTVHECEMLRRKIDLFNPDIVVLAYVVNDAEPQMNVPRSPKAAYRFAYLWSYESLKDFLNKKFPKKCHFKVNIERYEDYLVGFEPGNPKWKESKKALRDIVSICKKRGIIVVVAILPDVTQRLDDSYRWRRIHDCVSEWCHEFNIDSIDLLPYFLGSDHDKLWVPGDGHPNAIAHQKIAEILSSYLKGVLNKAA
ncbi:MAG: SGNH/GDSL hydrolase family protein [Candidatus Omnitrophica bacterium]|nr:SGNH/GDSL hydrolase family protein [Candidatus Omnitrophota bacterium]